MLKANVNKRIFIFERDGLSQCNSSLNGEESKVGNNLKCLGMVIN